MTTTSRTFTLRLLPALIGLSMLPGQAFAQPAEPERESLESLRQTTLQLIDALVANGILTRERADALLKKAREGTVAATTPREPAKPDTTVRVPYVPQVVRDQIRDEVKKEVVAQAQAERWGVPGETPEWTQRIKVDGDVRFRFQGDQYNANNPSPLAFVEGASNTLATRAPDLAAVTATRSSGGNSFDLPSASTQGDRDRLRLRARLGLTAQVSPQVSAGLRLATGSATDRVSTNQTLGQNFNRYQILLDRAYIKLDPAPWSSTSVGRIANPWFSTNLIWSENLSFEGAASTLRWPGRDGADVEPFATVGAFPIRESALARSGRWLYGAQAGVQLKLGAATRVKFGLAQYRYKNVEGRADDDYLSDATNSFYPGPTYGQYEYDAGLRQRGNTLFATNNVLDSSCVQGGTIAGCKWGLVSKFRPVALTASVELAQFAPTVLTLTGEYVRNQGYDVFDIASRTGRSVDQVRAMGGRRNGFGLSGTLGRRELRERGDWQATIGYRWLGSDAVLDGFTDSDHGLGGTNQKGYSMGFAYTPWPNTSFGLRYIAVRTIDSPTVQPNAGDVFKVSNLQVDLSSRF